MTFFLLARLYALMLAHGDATSPNAWGCYEDGGGDHGGDAPVEQMLAMWRQRSWEMPAEGGF